jgi:hypothetical protein
VGVVRAELLLMLDEYGVGDELVRAELTELQKLGKQRGWWWRFGQLPTPFATFLGLESAAVALRIFEPLMITGLLQTEEYARAIAETCDIGMTAEDIERQIELRMERQQQILGEKPPDMWVIIDEAALRRQVGGPEVMAAQLRRLVAAARSMTLQVVPFSLGGYPGVRGALTIFEFDERMHSPVAYVEGQAGNLYMEKSDDLRRSNLVFQHMSATALGKRESVALVSAIADEYAAAAGRMR